MTQFAELKRDISMVTDKGGTRLSRSFRVLVVDDYPDAAETTALMLRMSGNEVVVAHDGLDALRRAVSFQPELVLLDLAMPRMAGYEIAPKLREVVTPNPLIVALTGYGRQEDRRRCAEADFDLHLLKPVEPGVLNTLPVLLERVAHNKELLSELSTSITSALRELVRSQLEMAYTYLDVLGTTSLEATRQRCELKVWRIYERLSRLPGIQALGIEKELRKH